MAYGDNSKIVMKMIMRIVLVKTIVNRMSENWSNFTVPPIARILDKRNHILTFRWLLFFGFRLPVDLST